MARRRAERDERLARERVADEQRAARARADPNAPELGGTQAEAELVCRAQGGEASVYVSADESLVIRCAVGGTRIFAAHISPETSLLDEVDVWFEGASLQTVRERFIERLGEPTVHVNDRGLRVFSWRDGAETWIVRIYERGVWVTARSW